ncbi:hypothetical protein D3C81_563680 [compost metagenome]
MVFESIVFETHCGILQGSGPELTAGRTCFYQVLPRKDVTGVRGTPFILTQRTRRLKNSIAFCVVFNHVYQRLVNNSVVLGGQRHVQLIHVFQQLAVVTPGEINLQCLVLINEYVGSAEPGNQERCTGLEGLILDDGFAVRVGVLERVGARESGGETLHHF